jgi:dipeptidyl aminopeptidase/acylaminoacyl peptidase
LARAYALRKIIPKNLLTLPRCDTPIPGKHRMSKSNSFSLFARFLLTMVLASALSLPAAAQRTTMSGGLVPGGDVSSYQISPDGQYAVFLADKDTDNKFELYSVRLSTGSIVPISGAVVSGGNVFDYQISPDSARVVFRGDLVTDAVTELFSAPIAAVNSRVTLSGAVVSGGSVLTGFQISPDSARVVFLGDVVADEVFELFSAPIAAANSRVTLSGVVVSGGSVSSFQISPDSARVVFTGTLVTNTVTELFSAPIAAANSRVTLSGTVVSGGAVFSGFKISPDSARVVFLGDVVADEVFELFSAPIAAANSRVTLSGAVVSGGSVLTGFQISPDSARVVFLGTLVTNTVTELFSAPIATANSRVTLSGAVVSGGDVDFSGFQISPDSARVVFLGTLVTNTVTELFSAPIATPNSRVALSGAVVSGGDVDSDFKISPDSARVVFRGDLVTDAVTELFSAPIAAVNSRVTLSGAVVSGGDVFSGFQISPDGARVVFRGDLVTDNVFELFSAPIAAVNSRVTLSGAVVSGGGVSSFQISPDSARVVFRGDVVADEVFELFRVQIGGKALALDFDGDDRVQALSDALMLARYQLGIRGAALTANALGVNATISSPVTIEAKIKAALEQTVP